MNSKVEQEFEAIARTANESANKVNCPLRDYIEGLELIIEELKISIEAAEADLDKDEDQS